MSRTPTACKDCGDAAQTQRGRCVQCAARHEAKRNADPKRRAYRDPRYLSQPFKGLPCWNYAVCGNMATGRDHLVPISIDPKSWNTRPACTQCNSSRGARA